MDFGGSVGIWICLAKYLVSVIKNQLISFMATHFDEVSSPKKRWIFVLLSAWPHSCSRHHCQLQQVTEENLSLWSKICFLEVVIRSQFLSDVLRWNRLSVKYLITLIPIFVASFPRYIRMYDVVFSLHIDGTERKREGVRHRQLGFPPNSVVQLKFFHCLSKMHPCNGRVVS